ncbi:MAG: phosphoribosylanthranilate isomerase [Rhodospirillaceae bacterium]|nr:phosphoribosylanthranilate isomerase [Rhodospirillaceae bacterium]
MTVQAKICGINTAPTLDAAVGSGAAFVGFVFYPPSPRCVTTEEAAKLCARVPASVRRVGLIVDEGDERIGAILEACKLDMLQLHGAEPPDRTAYIRAKFGLPVMKAISIAAEGDAGLARPYESVADWLLFDAKPPKQKAGQAKPLPGGNARTFDWTLLSGHRWSIPWMLSGGLHKDNVREAVRIAGADTVDVSSGVEDKPGRKNIVKIREFLETCAKI